MKLFVLLTVVAAAAANSAVRTGYAAAPALRTGYAAAPAVRAAPAAPLPLVRILQSESRSDDQGGYGFRFLSEYDTERQEQRSVDGTVSGSYSYVAPDGRLVAVRYVADALGFRAESDALPTPVPTEYPTPEVPSTEAAPAVRIVQEYSEPEQEQEQKQEQERAAEEPIVEYVPVYAYRAVSQ